MVCVVFSVVLLTLLLTFQAILLYKEITNQTIMVGSASRSRMPAIKKLDELSFCSEHEILGVKLRPRRLPRGFCALIVALVYHPH